MDKVECPKCNHVTELKDRPDLAGKWRIVQCPKCGVAYKYLVTAPVEGKP